MNVYSFDGYNCSLDPTGVFVCAETLEDALFILRKNNIAVNYLNPDDALILQAEGLIIKGDVSNAVHFKYGGTEVDSGTKPK